MNDPIEAFYRFVKAKPCCACDQLGAWDDPVEAAHIEGMISPKTDQLMPRSHSGPAAWIVVPLHATCHRTAKESIHNIGEEAFNRSLGKTPHYLWMKAASLLAEFCDTQLRVRKVSDAKLEGVAQ